ncbi:hypothetical protein JCM8115_006572 [Rhodotorula mucilaginosa]
MPRRGRPTAELVAQRKAAALDQAEAECREHGFHLSQPAGKARKGVKTVAGIARDFEVSKTTIQHRLRGGRSRADEGKERQALDPEEEERIIDYTAQAAQAQFPLAKRHVLQFANKIRRERGHTGPDLSEGWYRNFKKRHRGRLLVRRAKRLAKERNYAVSFGQMQGWWEDLAQVCDKKKIRRAAQVWNMDKKGFMVGQARNGSQELITVIEAVSAAGKVLPPAIIFAGQNYLLGWEPVGPEDDIPGALKGNSTSGYTDNKLSLEWLKFFDRESRKYVRYNAYEWRLLILDGHGSHETLEFLEYAFEHRIMPFLLIPHTTHLVQPLDVSLFGPLQHYYSQHLQESLRVGDSVGKGDFIRHLRSVRKQALMGDAVQAAFSRTGLWPIDLKRNTKVQDLCKRPAHAQPSHQCFLAEESASSDNSETEIEASVVDADVLKRYTKGATPVAAFTPRSARRTTSRLKKKPPTDLSTAGEAALADEALERARNHLVKGKKKVNRTVVKQGEGFLDPSKHQEAVLAAQQRANKRMETLARAEARAQKKHAEQETA